MLVFVLGLAALVLYLGCQAPAAGYARLDLADRDSGRSLLSIVLAEGTPATLTWHNSLFGQIVSEQFIVQGGRLVLERVAFDDPRDPYQMPVSPGDVKDLYQGGGAFSAEGVNRPFSEISFLLGEIGNPRFEVAGRTVDLKKEAGFGGRVRLAIRPAVIFEFLFYPH